jgi:hypothetical protein
MVAAEVSDCLTAPCRATRSAGSSLVELFHGEVRLGGDLHQTFDHGLMADWDADSGL